MLSPGSYPPTVSFRLGFTSSSVPPQTSCPELRRALNGHEWYEEDEAAVKIEKGKGRTRPIKSVVSGEVGLCIQLYAERAV